MLIHQCEIKEISRSNQTTNQICKLLQNSIDKITRNKNRIRLNRKPSLYFIHFTQVILCFIRLIS